MRFGLSDAQFQILNQLAIQPIKSGGGAAWIFGSRARGDHREFSDVDLLYSFPHNIPVGLIGRVSENLEESRLPFKVDLVSERELADSYRAGVLAERVPV